MACPDRLGQEQDHLDPTDLGVAGRNAGDMGNGEEIEEDLEDLADLAGLAVDLRGEQELVLVLVEDEIRSEEADSIVSMMYTNYSTVEKGNPRNQKEGNGNLHMGFALSENKSRFTSEILHHLGACACRSNAQASIPSGSIEKLNLLRELQDHWAPAGACSLSQPAPPRSSGPSHRYRERQCTHRRYLKVGFLHRDCPFVLLCRMRRHFQARPLTFRNLSRGECQHIYASR